MNIFYLDRSAPNAAVYHCDKHVVKMCLEYAQILCTVARIIFGRGYIQLGDEIKFINSRPIPETLYKPTHEFHPCVRWASDSLYQARYVYFLLGELNNEYRLRYSRSRNHASFAIGVAAWDYLSEILSDLTIAESTTLQYDPPPQCMPEQYKIEILDSDSFEVKADKTVQAYRNYYIGDKARFATWKGDRIPFFMSERNNNGQQ